MPVNITSAYKYRRAIAKTPTSPISRRNKSLRADKEKNNSTDDPVPLENLGPPVLAWQTVGGKSETPLGLARTMKGIIDKMWAEIPQKGVHYEVVASVYQFRDRLAPLVLISQLYGTYAHATTIVDRWINEARKRDEVKQISVNVPGLSDLLIDSREFYKMLEQDDSGRKLARLARSEPEKTWFPQHTLEAHGIDGKDISMLVSLGFFRIDPSLPGVYQLTVPSQGAFIKHIINCRKWIQKALAKTKWRELPESHISEKLKCTKHYWKDLKGMHLEWLLYDGVGEGYIDGFSTPIGRGWKLVRAT